MPRPLPDHVTARGAEALPPAGTRVLCLAPPGELGALAALYLAKGPAALQVRGLLSGEPYLHGPLPGGLGLIQGDPGELPRCEGPHDLVVAFASEPFVSDFETWLPKLVRCLRPGGRLQLDLPCAGFSAVLQACHPEAKTWRLPQPQELHSILDELRLRDLELGTWIELREYPLLGDLVEDLVAPFPLHFEGRAGRRRLATLRENLASAFEGADTLAVALRRVRVRGMR